MRKITEIIVHCTATRADWWAGKRTSDKVREIKRWHVQDRGWSDIGYHVPAWFGAKAAPKPATAQKKPAQPASTPKPSQVTEAAKTAAGGGAGAAVVLGIVAFADDLWRKFVEFADWLIFWTP